MKSKSTMTARLPSSASLRSPFQIQLNCDFILLIYSFCHSCTFSFSSFSALLILISNSNSIQPPPLHLQLAHSSKKPTATGPTALFSNLRIWSEGGNCVWLRLAGEGVATAAACCVNYSRPWHQHTSGNLCNRKLRRFLFLCP